MIQNSSFLMQTCDSRLELRVDPKDCHQNPEAQVGPAARDGAACAVPNINTLDGQYMPRLIDLLCSYQQRRESSR